MQDYTAWLGVLYRALTVCLYASLPLFSVFLLSLQVFLPLRIPQGPLCPVTAQQLPAALQNSLGHYYTG